MPQSIDLRTSGKENRLPGSFSIMFKRNTEKSR